MLTTTACTPDAKTEVGKRADALNNSVWGVSEWIAATNAPVVTEAIAGGNSERAADGASWFVSTVKNDKKVTEAKWMTTGLGTFDLYINGRLVGTEVLKPGFTHYAKTKRSFTYDVTDAIDTAAGGENVFAAEVTPGWWADKIITPGGNQGMIGKKPAFRGVLQLTYDDGTTECLGTNTTDWVAGVAGPVRHAAIFDGEEYDARELPGYETLDKLSTPEVFTEFNGEILPSEGAEIYKRHDIAIKPVEVYSWTEIEGANDQEYGKVVIDKEYTPGQEIIVEPGQNLVIDFGQNSSAVPEYVFSAEEGTTLTFLPGELLNDGNGAKSRGMDGPEGSVHRLNLRTPDIAFFNKYTFGKDKGYVTYSPRHTFFGYRYATINTDGGPVKIKSIKSIPVTSISKEMETGVLTTGNDMVNKLISNTVWGQRSNYLSVPTDCPQRNERLGWTADTQVFAKTGSFFANTRDFFHKWMRDMRDTQSALGGFPGVAPIAQYGCFDSDMMRVGWADAGVIVPWTVWKQFADTEIIDENWDAMEKFMNHVYETKYDHQALAAENGNYQWADWLSYEPLESCSGRAFGPDGVLPETLDYWNYLNANYWLIDAGMMADMARATGRDAQKYENMVTEARDYIKTKFFNENGEFKTAILNTMQTPALFALKNKTVDGEQKDKMIANLRKNFEDHGNCLQTGFLGTSILMPTLTENGMTDIAYELLLQRKNPSWLYSVDNGATTIWERWNSYMIEHGMGPQGMNSFNHYAYGCVAEWMWETMAGIATDTTKPGFKNIIMAPVPDKRIGSLNATYNSAAGPISSDWKYEGDTWTWNFTIPEGATATVTVPGEDASKEYSAGTYTVVKELK